MRVEHLHIESEEEEPADLEKMFRDLADNWYQATGHFSSITRAAMHPSYQRIIGMGKPAIPLLLDELRQRGGHWLWALNAITGEDPGQGARHLREAQDAWIMWGIKHKYIS